MTLNARSSTWLRLSLLSAAPLWGCGEAKALSNASALPQPVHVATIEHQNLSPPVHATGVSFGKQEVQLAFKNGGTVAALRVEAGSRVRRGQPLATLNQVEIHAQVAQARAGLEKAERDERRLRQLQESGSTPLSDVENAHTGLKVARAALEAASYNAHAAQITAPEDGTIVRRLAEVAELVAGGQPIYTLRSTRQGFVVRVGLTDRDAVAVRVGAPAKVNFTAFPGRVFKGHLTELASAASARTGTYEGEIKVEAGDTELLSGLVADVELPRAQTQSVDLIPIEALVEGSGDHGSIFVVGTDSKVRKLPVQVAFIEGSKVAIRSGLDGVGAVITDGASYLSPGLEVRVVQ